MDYKQPSLVYTVQIFDGDGMGDFSHGLKRIVFGWTNPLIVPTDCCPHWPLRLLVPSLATDVCCGLASCDVVRFLPPPVRIFFHLRAVELHHFF